MRRRGRFKRLQLSLMFSAVVLVILLITMAIMGGISALLLHLDVIDLTGRQSLLLPFLMLLFASLVVGMVVSLGLSRLPLRPIRKVIAAMKQLASGDFSVRLEVRGPPEVEELTRSFNVMAEELGGLEVLRTDFVNNFSHEFKTPIASIKGFAEILRGEDDLTQAEREEYLDIIISESGRLSSLSTNVLNLSKVENQSILTEKSQFDISEQIRQCILLFQTQWQEKNITLDLHIKEIKYKGNAELLNQVWINLMHNAMKFAPESGTIRIDLFTREESLVFEIYNNGPSISEQERKHIFDKFYQTDTSHAAEGNGLGLTLAHRIIQLHGGSIICENKEPEGTIFIVHLPL